LFSKMRNLTVNGCFWRRFAGLSVSAWALLGCPATEAPGEDGGCRKDTDCKGERICEAGACVAPRPAEASPGPAAAASPAAASAGMPEWTRGGPGSPRPSLGTGPEGQPSVVWDVDLGAVVFAAPTLGKAAGEPAALVGTHAGRFVAVAVEGAKAGQVVLDVNLGGMVWGTAAVADGRAYVGADDDTLYAIDLANGAVVWTLKVGNCDGARVPGPEGARCDADGGPTIGPDGDLYLGADGVYRVGRDGKVRWHYPADTSVKAKHVFSAPLVTADGHVVVGTQDGLVVALKAADGGLRWTYNVRADVDGAAAMGEDGNLFVGADDGRLYALRSDGSLRWSFVTQKDIRSAAAVSTGGVVYVGSFDGNLYALAPTGDVKWVLPTGGRIAGAPVIDAAGTIYVGSQDDHLYAVSPKGQVRWSFELPGDVDSSVAITDGGTVVVGCDDGHLRALR
jgi:outer membrane protein assembly factor BamB